MKSYTASNIKYETDGEKVSLPKEIKISVPNDIKEYDEIEQYISDKISDQTGFLHNGFSLTPEIK